MSFCLCSPPSGEILSVSTFDSHTQGEKKREETERGFWKLNWFFFSSLEKPNRWTFPSLIRHSRLSNRYDFPILRFFAFPSFLLLITLHEKIFSGSKFDGIYFSGKLKKGARKRYERSGDRLLIRFLGGLWVVDAVFNSMLLSHKWTKVETWDV